MATPRKTWEELGASSRAGLLAGGLAIVLFMGLAVWWLLRDEGRVLYSGLDPQEAAAVVAELERMKVDYELAEAGTRIVVPGSQVDAVRLKMSGSSVSPGGGVGFEVFDDSDFGVTEFAQRINFQRAMQGELSRTISALREVKRARVHLVMPQQTLFSSRRQPASAAVNLVLAQGAVLDDPQVLGIQRMVASSVEGLEPGRVTVIDQDGVTLSRPAAEQGDVESVSARLAKKQEVETYLREKVASVLERSLGADIAVVSIDVSLAMDQVKTTIQEVVTRADGMGWVKRQRETRSWSAADGDTTGDGDGSVTTETEYDLGRSVEEIVSTPGGVERLSVGVLLPGPVEDTEIAKIREVVAMTVGLSTARGDSIAVHAIDWPAAAAAQLEPEAHVSTAPPVGAATAPSAQTEAAARESREGRLPWWSFDALEGTRWAPALVATAAAMALLAVLVPRLRASNGLSNDERSRVLGQLRAWIRADGEGKVS